MRHLASNIGSAGADALLEAFAEHERVLRGVALGVLHDPSAVEDVLQEALARALAASRGAIIQNPKSYLFIAVRNIAFSAHKTQRTDGGSLEELTERDVFISEPLQDQVVEDRERLKVFAKAVEALPPQCKAVFTMKKLHGLSQKVIAEKLDISESTVEKHLSKAMMRCRNFMAVRGYPFGSGK